MCVFKNRKIVDPNRKIDRNRKIVDPNSKSKILPERKSDEPGLAPLLMGLSQSRVKKRGRE